MVLCKDFLRVCRVSVFCGAVTSTLCTQYSVVVTLIFNRYYTKLHTGTSVGNSLKITAGPQDLLHQKVAGPA